MKPRSRSQRPRLLPSRRLVTSLRLAAGCALFLALVVVVFFARDPWDERTWQGLGFRLLGHALAAAGAAGRLWCQLHIGGVKNRVLVTDGPYSLCRNPLYLSTMIASLGVLLCFEAPVLLPALAAYAGITYVQIVEEEGKLLRRFPQEYPEYCRRVPRVIPWFKGFRPADATRCPASRCARAVLQTAVLLGVPFLAYAVDAAQLHHRLPLPWPSR